MAEKQFDKLKNHYCESFIKDIDDTFLRCRILGKIIEIKDVSLIIDDGTGIIEVIFNEDITKNRTSFEVGKDVLIFGKVINIDNQYKIFADIIRDVDDLSLKHYRKIVKIWKDFV